MEKAVIKPIDEMVTYNDLYSTMDHLWSTLFMTGYLTQRGRESDGRYCLAIPNREIRKYHNRTDSYTVSAGSAKKTAKWQNSSARHCLGGKSAEVESLLNLYLQKTVSVRDTFVRKSLKGKFLSWNSAWNLKL